MLRYELKRIEETILALFADRKTSRLLAKEIFEDLPDYTNSDLVRAFEDLEKSYRLVVRYTKEGDDWVTLTNEGAERVGLPATSAVGTAGIIPHPPKSSSSKSA